jgi:carbamate kinase
MSSSPSTTFESRPLLVLALGGNALSPPKHDVDDYAVERSIVTKTSRLLDRLICANYRLLVIHGNGPQVGRLLRSDPAPGNLDIHIAQTQGELGYLLTAATHAAMVCILTRAVVEPDLGPPVKPIGRILTSPPLGASAMRVGSGWRLTVPSPKPTRVLESDAIALLLRSHHVVAGGGGGVPLTDSGKPVNGVIDKDRIASLLAVEFEAEQLVFATDVDHVFENFDRPNAHALKRLSISEAQEMIKSGSVTAGSMAPKVESAIEFVRKTGRPARICALESIATAFARNVGTAIVP